MFLMVFISFYVSITMLLVRFRVWQWHSKLPVIWLIILGAPRPLGMDFGMVYEGFSFFLELTIDLDLRMMHLAPPPCILHEVWFLKFLKVSDDGTDPIRFRIGCSIDWDRSHVLKLCF